MLLYEMKILVHVATDSMDDAALEKLSENIDDTLVGLQDLIAQSVKDNARQIAPVNVVFSD